MIAALYVETDGVYYGLPDVDPWDEARDARLYDGPWPVVAHPPCSTWSVLGWSNPKVERGEDGGCFAVALEVVRRFGGVLEHPARSHAWRHFGLPRPARAGWVGSLLDDGWACQVDQASYGHPARKLTWLYYVGPEPTALIWRDEGRQAETVANMNKRAGEHRSARRSRTPVCFRDALLALAARR